MTERWILDQTATLPDQTAPAIGQIRVLDQAGAPGRTVCTIHGRLERHAQLQRFVRFLDDRDFENARLIIAAPQLHSVIKDLLAWAEFTGGWEAPCWDNARSLLDTLQRPGSQG